MSTLQGIIYAAFVGGALASIYWFIVRPYLARLPALRNIYEYLDAKEAGPLAKLRVSVSGLKRKLFARLVWLAGILVGLHDFALPLLGLIDIQPFIPPQYVQFYPFATALLGMLFEYLSKISVTPVGEVNPGVIADASDTSIATVAAVTAPDPVVATPTQEQQKAA